VKTNFKVLVRTDSKSNVDLLSKVRTVQSVVCAWRITLSGGTTNKSVCGGGELG